MTQQQFVFGITGWKNAGKTTLAERLVGRVATVKHGHHAADIKPGTDSFRHRAADD
jgi:molybdopterin-guanine dinucleotide biosynthesis adapter protein